MYRIPLWSIVVVAGLSACSRPSVEPFAVSVPSAVVELRDGPSAEELSRETQVVVLGTGTPVPDAHRAGSSTAVIHKGEAYLFDVGAGAVRNAAIARYRYDIPSLYPTQICCVFLTHLHNDHTQDLSELATTMWWRRQLAEPEMTQREHWGSRFGFIMATAGSSFAGDSRRWA